ncbi:MAG: hypothetical protein LBL80_06475 [Ruminococcus sp.]|jgi:hypothetical protein|nr:hypothetical protein [Ruminococcus sp.]
MEEALVATIIGGIIAGVFGLITKYLELRFDKKKDEQNPPIKDMNSDGKITAAEHEAHAEAVIETFEKKHKFSWFEKNFRKLSTAGFVVAGVVVVGIIAMIAIPAIKNSADDEEIPVLPALESVTAETTAAVTAAAPDSDKYVDSIARIVTKDDFLAGNIFAVTYKSKLYFVTDFNSLLSVYNRHKEDGFYIDFNNQNDIFSKDLTLAGYSPLYNIAILTPNSVPDIEGFVLSEKEAAALTEITVIGSPTNDRSKRDIARTGKIIKNDYTGQLAGSIYYLTDADIDYMGGAPVLAEDLVTVVGINADETIDNDSLIVPESYIKTVLDEMLKPDSEITPFPVDELPQKFDYFIFDHYVNVDERRSVGGTFMLNLTDGNYDMGNYHPSDDNSELYWDGLAINDGNYGDIFDYETNTGIIQGNYNSLPVLQYGYLTGDGSTDYERPFFRYYKETNHMYIQTVDGLVAYSVGTEENINSEIVSVYNSDVTVGVRATKTGVEYYDDGKLLFITPENTSPDLSEFDGKMPENLKLTVNEDGNLLRLTDTATGAYAYLNEDGTFGAVRGDLSGGFLDTNIISIKKETIDGAPEDNIGAVIEKTDAKSIAVQVLYEAIGSTNYMDMGVVDGELAYSALYDNEKDLFWYPSTNAWYTDVEKNIYFLKALDRLVVFNSDSYKGMIIGTNGYVICQLDENFNRIGEPYPYLLDYNDIPDTAISTGGE